MTHPAFPTIKPGLVVRYKAAILRGKERTVTRVEAEGAIFATGDGLPTETVVSYGVSPFWDIFEPVEDDAAHEGAWVVWQSTGFGLQVLSIFETELYATRAALVKIKGNGGDIGVAFVEYGSDVIDVVRATRSPF